MTREELIISGVAVDLGNAKISLAYVNNVLTGIDSITASHSYTITLPHTATNSRVFGYAESVANRSDKVGRYLSAEYRRNGITIVRNAMAYITGITPEGIEVCLFWDGLSRFTDWKKESPKISAIDYGSYIWQGSPTEAYDYYNDVVEAVYDTGVSNSVMPPTPCVNLAGLFSKVMEQVGEQWSIRVSGMYTEMEHLFVPLAKRGGTRTPSIGGQWTQVRTNAQSFVGLGRSNRVSGSMDIAPSTQGVNTTDFDRLDVDMNFYVSPAFRLNPTNTPVLYVRSWAEEQITTLATITATADAAGNLWFKASYSLDVSSYDRVYFYFSYMRANAVGYGSFSVVPTPKLAIVGDIFDVGGNLPDITQADLIKAVCVLFGCQLVNNTDGTLSYVSVDTIYGRKGDALDWTDKVVNWQGVPASVQFTIGSFARRNWLRYAEPDKDYEVVSEACLYVDNDALDTEKDAAVLPFAATAGNRVHHYETNKDGQLEDVEVTPRVLRGYEDEEGMLALSFDATQQMPAVYDKWYGGLRRLLEYPVQIKVYARLDERDLAGLDWTRPVYLGQTGHYYIVASVNTDNDGEISEIELIQM